MNSSTEMTQKMQSRLSTLWIFAVLNYIYADVFTVFHTLSNPDAMKEIMSGNSGPFHMTSGAFLAFAALMETSMIMVPLGRFLPYKANRWANIAVGIFRTIVALVFLFIGGLPTAITYYTLFVFFEVVCTVLIVWLAWRWKEAPAVTAVGNC
jgi:hypothetical protein